MNVSIIGLGYVGLPLALLAAKSHTVTGVDVDQNKIDLLTRGVSYVDDITNEQIQLSPAVFTTEFNSIKESEIVIVCVPTPVDENKQPDLSPVISSVTSLSRIISKGSLVIIESTINPGVCEEIIIPLIEKISGMKVGVDVHIAHCPERINPGDKRWNVSNIDRVVGSTSSEGLDRAYSFYTSIIEASVKKMTTIKEAEAVKIVENSFRDINLAFVNELAMSFNKLGINLENVIDGAATKPFSFMPHHPGIGVGGHCIPVDPYYLIEYAGQNGFSHRFLKLAREINEHMPHFTFELAKKALEERSITSKSVVVLGMSYKADVADKRESPSTSLVRILEDDGFNVTIYDPYFKSESSVKSLEEALRASPLVILATNHREFVDTINSQLLKSSGVEIFIDGKNSFNHIRDSFAEQSIYYKGIGA